MVTEDSDIPDAKKKPESEGQSEGVQRSKKGQQQSEEKVQ